MSIRCEGECRQAHVEIRYMRNGEEYALRALLPVNAMWLPHEMMPEHFDGDGNEVYGMGDREAAEAAAVAAGEVMRGLRTSLRNLEEGGGR